MVSAVRASRTQVERREHTRRAILEATVACLVELGYAKTTTLEVQKRAGVSRGALLHHFPSKAELLTATVRHLAAMRGRELESKAACLPDGGDRSDDRAGAVIDLLWESFSGPLFYVAMELRNAARTDSELRAVLVDVERDVHHKIVEQSSRLFGQPVASRPGFVAALDTTLQFMIGAAMTAILHRDEDSVEPLLSRWKATFPQLLDLGPEPGAPTEDRQSSDSNQPTRERA